MTDSQERTIITNQLYNTINDNYQKDKYNDIEADFEKKFNINFQNWMKLYQDDLVTLIDSYNELGGIPTEELNLDEPLDWMYNRKVNVIEDAINKLIKM